MAGVVPIFGKPYWEGDDDGTQMAMVSGESFVDDQLGLDYDADKNEWHHPRVSALRNKKIKVEDLDDEELQRGQVRDPDGKFRGGPARRIPKEFHEEYVRRILANGTEKLEANYLAAIDLLTDIVKGNKVEKFIDNKGVEHDVPASLTLRVNTAKYIIERLAGKTPDKIEVAVEMKPWEVTMQAISRTPSEEVILEAQVLEEEHHAKVLAETAVGNLDEDDDE